MVDARTDRRRLAGKSALVTGAGSGIGRAISRAFGAEGAGVTCADVDAAAARATAEAIVQEGGSAIAVGMDVTRAADCDRAVEAAVAAHGGLDVLVNGAGILIRGDALEVTEEQWDRQQAVNVKGVFLATRSALPVLIARGGGNIIIIASIAGLRGNTRNIAYAASKHAVIGITRCLALDHGRHGIRVNAICPGIIDTPMAGLIHRDRGLDQSYADFLAGVAAAYPLGRVGTPEDVAAVAVHLASPEAGWPTGVIYTVDGGASLHTRI